MMYDLKTMSISYSLCPVWVGYGRVKIESDNSSNVEYEIVYDRIVVALLSIVLTEWFQNFNSNLCLLFNYTYPQP